MQRKEGTEVLMRRTIGIILFVLCAASGMSAEVSADTSADVSVSERIAHTNVLKIKSGWSYQLDTYLSPLAYNGWQLGIGNEWWQPFRHDTRLGKTGRLDNWAHVGRVEINGFQTVNPARTNLISGMDFNGGWGAFYCWKWLDNRLKVFVGPYLEAGLTVRYISANVNKPVSLDLAADVMAMSGLSWSFYGKKTSYRLHYQIRTNLVGFDCMPHYWQSYYELTEGVPGVMRCSGHWNHHTVKHELGMDMQFIHSTWRVGVGHDYNNYHSENLQFIRSTVSFIIGCIWNYQIKANNRL